jgi:hypothetical protein
MMGILTTAEMITEVRSAIGQPSETDVPDTRITLWLDWSYRHVCRPKIHRHREMRVKETITLVTGQRNYDVASDYFSTYSLANTTVGYRLIPMDQRRQDEPLLTSSRPQFYDIDWYTDPLGQTTLSVLLYPNVASGYGGNELRHRYWKMPVGTDTSGLTAATEIDSDWDEVIIVGAIWRGWRHRRSVQRAEIHKAEFAQLINEIPDRLVADVEDKDWGFEVEIDRHQGVS